MEYQFSDRRQSRRKQKNKFEICGDYIIGYTTKNQEFYFDKSLYEVVQQFIWYIDNNGYARTNYKQPNKSRTYIYLHHLVLGLSVEYNNIEIDHINGNKRDNRKTNLRIATKSGNNMNQGLRKDNTSGVKGVHWDSRKQKWISRIQANNKRILLGHFDNYSDAVQARMDGEKEYHKDYSYYVSQRVI